MSQTPNTPRIFWSQYTPEPNTGCWLWTGSVLTKRMGYGQVCFNYKKWRAHRLAFLFANGYLTPGLDVCHRCDQPSCINPDHLFLGTRQENLRDMVRKGRRPMNFLPHSRGEDCAHAKLTWSAVAEIRLRHSSGESFSSLGRRYGVSASAAHEAFHGYTWSKP